MSHSSGLVKITGIAFGWIGATMSFGAVVRKPRGIGYRADQCRERRVLPHVIGRTPGGAEGHKLGKPLPVETFDRQGKYCCICRGEENRPSAVEFANGAADTGVAPTAK